MPPKRNVLMPDTPEGQYWFGRHSALIQVWVELSKNEKFVYHDLCREVLTTEKHLDLDYMKEMTRKVITVDENTVLHDS